MNIALAEAEVFLLCVFLYMAVDAMSKRRHSG